MNKEVLILFLQRSSFFTTTFGPPSPGFQCPLFNLPSHPNLALWHRLTGYLLYSEPQAFDFGLDPLFLQGTDGLFKIFHT